MLRDDGSFYIDDRMLSEMTPEEIAKYGIGELSEEEKKEVCRKVGIEYKEYVKRIMKYVHT
jgi:hypothetical protein